MAKDEKLGGLLSGSKPAQPEEPWPADNSDLDEGRIIANGVGLRYGELTALDHDMTWRGMR
jgi:hypothetical protein